MWDPRRENLSIQGPLDDILVMSMKVNRAQSKELIW